MNRKNIFFTGLLLFIAGWLVKPFFGPGFFPIHDNQSVGRLYEMDQALKDGQFPVRWVKDLGFGYGYPLFIFYPPLAYYLGEAWHLVGFDHLDSTKIIYALSLILSGLTMYVWVSRRFRPEISLIASLFYILAPYRAVDLYVRGALAECFSFVWLPLILMWLEDWFDNRQILSAVKAGAAMALLMVTHNLIALPFGLVLMVYTGIKITFKILEKNETPSYGFKDYLTGLTFFGLVAISLSAFFWLPSLYYQKDTIVGEILLQNLYAYKLHFVTLSQLWNSLWGFGGSVAGIPDGMSFKIGKIHVLVAFASLLMIFIRKIDFQKRLSIILWLILFTVSAYMMTGYSQFVWQVFTPLHYLQFPWRFLTMAVLFTSILAAYFLDIIKSHMSKPVYWLVYIVLLIGLIKPNVKLFRPQQYLDVDDRNFVSEEALRWNNSQTSFEFAPKGIQLIPSQTREQTLALPAIQTGYARYRLDPLVSKNYTAKIITDKSSMFEFTIEATKDTLLTLNMFAFPGWILTIDDNKQNFTDDNKQKLITIDIPAGQHWVKLEYLSSAVVKWANCWSLAAIMAVGFYLVKGNAYAKR